MIYWLSCHSVYKILVFVCGRGGGGEGGRGSLKEQ